MADCVQGRPLSGFDELATGPCAEPLRAGQIVNQYKSLSCRSATAAAAILPHVRDFDQVQDRQGWASACLRAVASSSSSRHHLLATCAYPRPLRLSKSQEAPAPRALLVDTVQYACQLVSMCAVFADRSVCIVILWPVVGICHPQQPPPRLEVCPQWVYLRCMCCLSLCIGSAVSRRSAAHL